MQLSYWEVKNWFTGVDYTVIGSGIVGLHTALRLRERFPKSRILILEKGALPQGASTKNAGFACFGSLSEIIEDLKSHSEDDVLHLIEKRWKGLGLLRKRIGDAALDYRPYGGYELFLKQDESTYAECRAKMPFVNDLLRPFFKSDVYSLQTDRFNFGKTREQLVFNPFEGQIDSGMMMQALLKQVAAADIQLLNSQELIRYETLQDGVMVQLKDFSFTTRKLVLATNGFAAQQGVSGVVPARAQVLITEPIPNLDLKGTFHLDKGYYYFRNVGDRILFGGARNLDFAGETTTTLANTKIIQDQLELMLKEVILPQHKFRIAQRWSGIMGTGPDKNPIVKPLSDHVYCGVKLSGIGIAIGGLIGQELADLV